MTDMVQKPSNLPAKISHLSASYAISVPISIAIVLEQYAEDNHIHPETAIVEAVRAWCGER